MLTGMKVLLDFEGWVCILQLDLEERSGMAGRRLLCLISDSFLSLLINLSFASLRALEGHNFIVSYFRWFHGKLPLPILKKKRRFSVYRRFLLQSPKQAFLKANLSKALLDIIPGFRHMAEKPGRLLHVGA